MILPQLHINSLMSCGRADVSLPLGAARPTSQCGVNGNPSCSGSVGDPVMYGFAGRSFNFIGDVGKIYNIISAENIQASMLFRPIFSHAALAAACPAQTCNACGTMQGLHAPHCCHAAQIAGKCLPTQMCASNCLQQMYLRTFSGARCR